MSIERVRAHLKAFGLEDRIHTFSVSSATVELAAKAVGCEPGRIIKTLSFSDGQGGCILVLAAGDARIDNGKFKAAFGIKARMLSPEQVQAFTGYGVGGVCPFGMGDGVRVCADQSIGRHDVVSRRHLQQHGTAERGGTGIGKRLPGMGGRVQGYGGVT